mmetsp:Transcript_15683/g.52487  ORF Transcript_15683/g.52487 Transcript_15683/m.52487 type:complete len:220 (-) Transcript_15683:153-812(-)
MSMRHLEGARLFSELLPGDRAQPVRPWIPVGVRLLHHLQPRKPFPSRLKVLMAPFKRMLNDLCFRYVPCHSHLLLSEPRLAQLELVRKLVVCSKDGRDALDQEQDHDESVQPEATLVLGVSVSDNRPLRDLRGRRQQHVLLVPHPGRQERGRKRLGPPCRLYSVADDVLRKHVLTLPPLDRRIVLRFHVPGAVLDTLAAHLDLVDLAVQSLVLTRFLPS